MFISIGSCQPWTKLTTIASDCACACDGDFQHAQKIAAIYFQKGPAILGCHFSRDDFLGIFFDFLILIAFPPSLQWIWWCHPCLWYVYFCLPSGLRVCNLLSCQPVRLKAYFQRSGCHAPGIPQTWQKNGQTNLVPISGRVPVLNLEFFQKQSQREMALRLASSPHF